MAKKRGFIIAMLLACLVVVMLSVGFEERERRREELKRIKAEEINKEMLWRGFRDLNEPDTGRNKKRPVKVEREYNLQDCVARIAGGSTAFLLF